MSSEVQLPFREASYSLGIPASCAQRPVACKREQASSDLLRCSLRASPLRQFATPTTRQRAGCIGEALVSQRIARLTNETRCIWLKRVQKLIAVLHTQLHGVHCISCDSLPLAVQLQNLQKYRKSTGVIGAARTSAALDQKHKTKKGQHSSNWLCSGAASKDWPCPGLAIVPVALVSELNVDPKGTARWTGAG